MKALKRIIEDERDNIPGVIENIDYFKTWFNKNLAIVISSVHGSFCKYEATLIIYEPAEKRMKEILEFKSILSDSKLHKIKEKIVVFKKN